ncbi:transcriptional regulator [Streptomyces sp. WAC 01325]|uniref:helix-turn-helix domain-containing protein n=1 Tax=Streptomyces sp. WAC 01325 TaxID=2203202 RepID=UPI000F88A0BE|nr:helix-turn-helix transcriptional regulator [Streptomyces sp. WAC 01325]RSM88430.1 transcriptional regulator [Streptomyces sp. WAC 01325]
MSSNHESPNITLGDFLRASRSRITPADVGLPDDGRHRKVPGLRREELALLANVSVDYIVRLEQGRAANVSPLVLEALASALRLEPDERQYLMNVGVQERPRSVAPTARSGQIRAQTQMLMDGLREYPALLLGRRMDVLAWNTMGAALLTDFAVLPPSDRNLVRLAFLDPRFRDLYVDWEKTARECVAYLRMDAARYPDDEKLSSLIGELSLADADFRRWWSDQRVKTRAHGKKRFNHPVVGHLDLNFQTFSVGNETDETLFVYTPERGGSAEESLRRLADRSELPLEVTAAHS